MSVTYDRAGWKVERYSGPGRRRFVRLHCPEGDPVTFEANLAIRLCAEIVRAAGGAKDEVSITAADLVERARALCQALDSEAPRAEVLAAAQRLEALLPGGAWPDGEET